MHPLGCAAGAGPTAVGKALEGWAQAPGGEPVDGRDDGDQHLDF